MSLFPDAVWRADPSDTANLHHHGGHCVGLRVLLLPCPAHFMAGEEWLSHEWHFLYLHLNSYSAILHRRSFNEWQFLYLCQKVFTLHYYITVKFQRWPDFREGSTINLPWACTVTSLYLSRYDFATSNYVKLH